MTGITSAWIVVLCVSFGISNASSLSNASRIPNTPAVMELGSDDAYFDGPDVEYGEAVDEQALLQSLKTEEGIQLVSSTAG